jgi:hypothetical protein
LVTLLDRGAAERDWIANWMEYMPVGSGSLPVDEFKVLQAKLHSEFYYSRIKKDPGAKLVKLADIEDNRSPWRLSYLSDETQVRLDNKYTKALELLNA